MSLLKKQYTPIGKPWGILGIMAIILVKAGIFPLWFNQVPAFTGMTQIYERKNH